MSSIMMDRWGIDCAVDFLKSGAISTFSYHYGHSKPPRLLSRKIHNMVEQHAVGKIVNQLTAQCWDNFLTSIILWDEIWSCHSELFDWESILPDTPEQANSLYNIVHLVNRSMLDHDLQWMYRELRMGPNVDPRSFSGHYKPMTLSRRTKYYQAISCSLGVPYLAHPLRTNLPNKPQPIFNRNDIVEAIDRELERYYSEINNQIGRNLYKFNYPVLIDLIKKGSNSPKEELSAALRLRQEPDVVDFRNSMYQIEQTVQRGNTQLLLAELKTISDLAKEITEKYKHELLLGEISLSLTPAISLPIHLEKSCSDRLHVTFVRRLLNYGVYKRSLESR